MTASIARRRFLAASAGLAGAAALPGRLSAASGPFTIYMLTFRGETEVERGYRDYLAQRRIEANIIVRDAERDARKVAGFLPEIREVRPDLVYTWGTPVTLATIGAYDAVDPKVHITDIPVVFTMVAAPVKGKVVPDLASSGRNVTGSFHVVPTDAQLRAMQSYREFGKLGVIYTPNEQNSIALLEELRQLAQVQGFELIERPLKLNADGNPVADGVEDLMLDLKHAGADWFYLLPDTFLGTILDRVTPFSRKIGLPTFGASELAVREGGALAGLICRYYSVGQLAAVKSEQILVNKIAPASIPVETLRRFSLIVNMEAARALHLYPPLAMLNYAEVIRA